MSTLLEQVYRTLATGQTLSGEALAQEREWTLDASEQESYLIFGVADSDDVGLSLWCPNHKGIVNLYVPRPTAELQKLARRKVPMTVTAGSETATFGGKIDINNCSVRRFQAFPGMYPTLAGKIVLGGPYASVDDVLNLDLTDRQKELFTKYKDNFTVTDAVIALNEGDDRINDGQYR